MARLHHFLLSHPLWGGGGWMGRPLWTFLAWCGIHRKVSSLWAAVCRFSCRFLMNNLRPGCIGGDQTGALPFCEATPIVFVSCEESVAQAAVLMTSAVERSFVPPNQGRRGDCRSVTGPGRILFPLLPGYQAHWWVLPHPQPAQTQPA